MKDFYLFFDLDGTISDSAEGIINSVIYALTKMGLEAPPREKLYHFIGPPLIRTFCEDYHLSPEKGLETVEFYREYYNVKGIYECRMYDGIENVLRELQREGFGLVLATSKPTVMARRVIEYFGLSDCFDLISGPDLDGARNEKHEVIAYAMDQLGITDPRRCVMIGDRKYDALGAKICGMDCVGVLWGFGSKQELTEAGVAETVEFPRELPDVLQKFLKKIQKNEKILKKQ